MSRTNQVAISPCPFCSRMPVYETKLASVKDPWRKFGNRTRLLCPNGHMKTRLWWEINVIKKWNNLARNYQRTIDKAELTRFARN